MVVLGKILPIAFAGLALLFIGNAIARPVMAQQTAGALTSTGIGIGESLGSVGQGTQGSGQGYQPPTQQVNSGQQGTQVSQNLGSLLTDAGERDENAYQAAIAQNIAQNLAGQGSPHGTASAGSGFSTSLGGFFKGR